MTQSPRVGSAWSTCLNSGHHRHPQPSDVQPSRLQHLSRLQHQNCLQTLEGSGAKLKQESSTVEFHSVQLEGYGPFR